MKNVLPSVIGSDPNSLHLPVSAKGNHHHEFVHQIAVHSKRPVLPTDIASRGLHVDDVVHVLNYNLPKMAEELSTEWGAGLQGRASTLAAGVEVLELRQVERTLTLKMEGLQTDRAMAEPPRRMIQNTLASRTLKALPGEVFV